jgi:hypothetical protein
MFFVKCYKTVDTILHGFMTDDRDFRKHARLFHMHNSPPAGRTDAPVRDRVRRVSGLKIADDLISKGKGTAEIESTRYSVVYTLILIFSIVVNL